MFFEVVNAFNTFAKPHCVFVSNSEFKMNFCLIKGKLHGAPLNLKLSAPGESADLFLLQLQLNTYSKQV